MRLVYVLGALSILLVPLAAAQEITVAAAADMSTALPELAALYTKQTGLVVNLSFGSSGNLANQIRNGAPFDVFFSADEEYPKQLIEERLADPDLLYRYAIGRLVVWVPKGAVGKFDPKGLAGLADIGCSKIAIANPQVAPYGRAAVAALRHAGIYDAIAPRLVIGENVSQASQFVESGNASCGVIPLSHALRMKNAGEYWTVPLDDYPELYQAVVVVTRSKHKDAAHQFIRFVQTPEAIALLARYGFSLPGGPHK